MLPILQSALGLLAFIGCAHALSEDRHRFPWRTAMAALLLQILLAAALLKLPPFKRFFLALNDLLLALERATTAGTGFVFANSTLIRPLIP